MRRCADRFGRSDACGSTPRTALALLLAFMALALGAGEARGDGDGPRPKEKDFPDGWRVEPYIPGERLTYRVSWKGIKAGVATVEVDRKIKKFRGVECYLLRTTTRSSDFISTFYEVDDEATSLVSVKDLRPLKFQKRLHEGSHRAHQVIYFDRRRKRITYYKRRAGAFKKRREFKDADDDVFDLLSVLWHVRTLDLKVGSKAKVTVCTGKRICEAEFEVKEEKFIKVDAGRFRAVRIAPKFRVEGGKLGSSEGLFVSEKIAEIWFDAGGKRPLLMKLDVPIGSARVELVKYRFPPPEKKRAEGGDPAATPDASKKAPGADDRPKKGDDSPDDGASRPSESGPDDPRR